MMKILRRYRIQSLIAITVILLVYVIFSQFTTYYLTVDEVMKDPAYSTSNQVNMVGDIVEGSFEIVGANEFKFNLISNESVIGVKYKGMLPQTFRENGTIVAVGRLNSNSGTTFFEADRLIVKCPEKYEPEVSSDE